MKKEDLKTGDEILFSSGAICIVLLNTNRGDVLREVGCDTHGDLSLFENRMSKGSTSTWGYIEKITRPNVSYKLLNGTLSGDVLWERTPEKKHIIDGVEYSESSLISIIKKAHKK